MKKIKLDNFQNIEEKNLDQFWTKAAKEVEEISRILGTATEDSYFSKFMSLENFEEVKNYKIELFSRTLNHWWKHMNYKECYWEKRNSGFFGLNSPREAILNDNEKAKKNLELLLFNQELFSSAYQVENNDLAKVMANIYLEREREIEDFIWETKKRLSLFKEDPFSLRENVVKLEKKFKNCEEDKEIASCVLKENAQVYADLQEKIEIIEKQKEELTKINNLYQESKNKLVSVENYLKEVKNKSWYQINTTSGKIFWGANTFWIMMTFVAWKRRIKKCRKQQSKTPKKLSFLKEKEKQNNSTLLT